MNFEEALEIARKVDNWSYDSDSGRELDEYAESDEDVAESVWSSEWYSGLACGHDVHLIHLNFCNEYVSGTTSSKDEYRLHIIFGHENRYVSYEDGGADKSMIKKLFDEIDIKHKEKTGD